MDTDHPTLISPFPSGIHPHAATIQQATNDWGRRFGFIDDAAYQRLDRLGYGILMARAYPNAALPALQLISDWNTWLFMLDDQCDEAGLGRDPARLARVHAHLLEILRGKRPKKQASPDLHALRDLTLRLHALGGKTWMGRFLDHFSAYCAANVWEATNRAEGRTPDAPTYLRMRPFTGAVYCYLSMIELAEQFLLPAEVHANPIVRRLTEMTNNIICWSNDIISVDKELRHGDVHNLVLIIRHDRGLSLPEAIEQVAARHNAEVSAFVDLAARLPAYTPAVHADLQRYVAGMQYWMRANIDWSAATSRYRPVQPSPKISQNECKKLSEKGEFEGEAPARSPFPPQIMQEAPIFSDSL